MKFTNGYWQMRPGLTPHFAQQVYDVKVEAGALTVLHRRVVWPTVVTRLMGR